MVIGRNMYMPETERMHVASDSNGTLMWRVILMGRSKYDGMGTATRPYCIFKTSRDAIHIGDIQGYANLSASQKRCHNRNNYLRINVQPSFAPFLFFVRFVWY